MSSAPQPISPQQSAKARRLGYWAGGTRPAGRYIPSLHWLAVATAAATFPLIFMGGLVTSHGAGMSVPDWPNSYGYNMFTFPPSQWVGGIFYEHTHRLMGTVVGFLSILLCLWAWRVETRRWVRWLATSVLLAVIAQGVLGGLRVVLVNLDLAIVHACAAQAFFCLAALAAVVTSRGWIENSGRTTGLARGPQRLPVVVRASSLHAPTQAQNPPHNGRGRWVVVLAIATVTVIYGQLMIGAVMRHDGAGLAIPDVPLAYGQLIPPADEAGLKRINDQRVWEMNLPRVTLEQVWVHFAHRAGAVLVCGMIGALAFMALREPGQHRAIRRPVYLLLVLLAAQMTLGVLTVLLRKPADIASAHVAVGALLLVTSFVLSMRALRLFHSPAAEMSTGPQASEAPSLPPSAAASLQLP